MTADRPSRSLRQRLPRRPAKRPEEAGLLYRRDPVGTGGNPLPVSSRDESLVTAVSPSAGQIPQAGSGQMGADEPGKPQLVSSGHNGLYTWAAHADALGVPCEELGGEPLPRTKAEAKAVSGESRMNGVICQGYG